jgi:hypothetical protein
VGHAAGMQAVRNATKNLTLKTSRKTQLGDLDIDGRII